MPEPGFLFLVIGALFSVLPVRVHTLVHIYIYYSTASTLGTVNTYLVPGTLKHAQYTRILEFTGSTCALFRLFHPQFSA